MSFDTTTSLHHLHLLTCSNPTMMRSQVTLLLLCMFVSRALSLKCYVCIQTGITPCTDTPTECPSQCLTSTSTVTISGGTSVDVKMKTCGAPQECQSGSLNMGRLKVSSNTQCCATELCNTQMLPAPAKQSPNGRMCYTCDDKGCSKTVSCEGNEDRCITATVQQGTIKASMKGCATKNICNATGQQQGGIIIESVTSCEGNLSNGSERFTLSFLLMVVPLLSSIFL